MTVGKDRHTRLFGDRSRAFEEALYKRTGMNRRHPGRRLVVIAQWALRVLTNPTKAALQIEVTLTNGGY